MYIYLLINGPKSIIVVSDWNEIVTELALLRIYLTPSDEHRSKALLLVKLHPLEIFLQGSISIVFVQVK